VSQDRKYRSGRIAPKQIQLIKMAQKELKLDDAVYRALLRDRFNAASCTDLSYSQAAILLDQFKQWGFIIIGRKGKPKVASRPVSRKRQIDKIEALLTIGGKSWAYADALALRICKVEKLAWVPEGQLYKIITALRKQAQREGWDLSGEE